MKIIVGCDEAGYQLKEAIKMHLDSMGHQVSDFGVGANEKALYPDIAISSAESVARGEHERAVLICGTGIGMAISANKVKGIRAAQAHDTYSAERAQKSNNAQIICLGARVLGVELARSIVDAWLVSSFQAGPSQAKVSRISEYEKKITL
ncbi:MAG: ribose-5-phosphate isomerase [Devosiaceae bacterium]|nr:ribose-5-phosphate isomerase [Devosiaceae bacterium]